MHELPGRCRGNASLIGEETAKNPISQSSELAVVDDTRN